MKLLEGNDRQTRRSPVALMKTLRSHKGAEGVSDANLDCKS